MKDSKARDQIKELTELVMWLMLQGNNSVEAIKILAQAIEDANGHLRQAIENDKTIMADIAEFRQRIIDHLKKDDWQQ